MKVKTLLKALEKAKEQYPDFEEWDVYLDQYGLMVPEDFKTIEETRRGFEEDFKNYDIRINDEYLCELIKSHYAIERMKQGGWKFVYSSTGDVYRNVAGFKINDDEEEANLAFFEGQKILGLTCDY